MGHYKSQCLKYYLKCQGKNQTYHQGLSAEVGNMASNCDDIWLVDSAASKHMTSHKEWFRTLKPLNNSEIAIQIGNNSLVYAKGFGSIEVKAFVNGIWEQHILQDSLYVPDL